RARVGATWRSCGTRPITTHWTTGFSTTRISTDRRLCGREIWARRGIASCSTIIRTARSGCWSRMPPSLRLFLTRGDDRHASSEKSGAGLSGGGLAGLGGAPGAAAGAADSAAYGAGRVRLFAGCGDLLPGAGDQPAAPHVGTLRNLSRELPTHLCEQVSAGAVAVSGTGLEAVWASLVWRV